MKEFIIVLVIAGGIFYFIETGGPGPIGTDNAISIYTSPTSIIITRLAVTHTPYPTYTPQATGTPYPTYTPYPTLTPYPAMLLSPREKRDKSMVGILWGVLFIALGLWGIWEWKEYHCLKIELRQETELKQIAVDQTRAESQKPIPRPIITNGKNREREDFKVSPMGRSISVKLLREFIGNRRDYGLTISKWIKREGWNQATIENILDWLAHEDIQAVTPRANGQACRWNKEYSAIQLQRIFAL